MYCRYLSGSAYVQCRSTRTPLTLCAGGTTRACFPRALPSFSTRTPITTTASASRPGSCGVAVDLAELFLSDKLVMRLSLGLCSVFFNNMLHTGKQGAFVVAQAVLAVFVVCTGGELAATFTVYSVFERLFVYTLALRMPTLLRQTKRHAHRVGSYMRMHVVGFRFLRDALCILRYTRVQNKQSLKTCAASLNAVARRRIAYAAVLWRVA